MRRIITILAVLLLAVGMSYAQSTKLLIAGSPHDMTLTNGASGCTVCHSPHNSDSALKSVLLWNPIAATDSYSTYTGSSGIADGTALDGTLLTVATDPRTGSYLCLSCHDGAAADANFTNVGGEFIGALWNGGATTTDGFPAAKPSAPRGTLVTQAAGDTDLTNDHPVNFIYPATGTQPASFEDIATIEATGLKFFGAAPTQEMHCATCHNPHDQDSGVKGYFLRGGAADVTNFCATCHL